MPTRTKPRSPRWKRPEPAAPPEQNIPGYIVRMRLVNGYWTYRPETVAGLNLVGKAQKWCRAPPPLPPAPHRKIDLKKDAWVWSGVSWCESKKGRRSRFYQWTSCERAKGPTVEGDGCRIEDYWTKIPQSGDNVEEGQKEKGAVRSRGVTPEREVPPVVRVRDDPVQSGRELAAAGDLLLPSDASRGRVCHGGDRGVSVISREEKEMQDLRRAIAASKEDVSLSEIVHDEPNYSIRVMPLRRKKKGAAEGTKGEVSDEFEVVDDSVQSVLVVEDGEHGSRDEIMQELEAQGWVPVDGWTEGEVEDELASIAESWIMANDDEAYLGRRELE
ncbi:hypothetical protein QBC34DRAFT_82944 [Podospora aff. communis PSN243]|uniref:Uncharacterized protein n=1 Tax=Podospora aff. communis PSN243 TaxID=3040156 RepID=A0AAV9GNF4_9PEZI|nr:hypothetical protein QBC34DRAFT_82944 [Podospora aff. communis PSN243]